MSERKSGRYRVGEVGVDAGMVMVGDPCYLDGFTDHEFDDAKIEAQKASGKYEYSYSGACAATLSEDSAGQLGRGSAVAVSSGYGDGVYPVYATYNDEGRITKMEVVFVSEEDEDEEDMTECIECSREFESDGNDACEECRSTDDMDEDEEDGE